MTILKTRFHFIQKGSIMKILGFYITRTNWKIISETQEVRVNLLLDRIIELKNKLKQSQRNDMPRDPKTGRFIKRA